jgi:hypothetical protein
MDRADSRHVLDGDVPGSKLAHDSSELGPESSLRMVEASARAGVRSALAGEAAGDEVDGLKDVSALPSSFPVGPGLRAWPSFAIPCGVGRSVICSSDGSDVIENRDSWPALGEQGAAVGFAFDEPCVSVSGLVESGVEESGTGEEGADIHFPPPDGSARR